jgi:hypothetical protein
MKIFNNNLLKKDLTKGVSGVSPLNNHPQSMIKKDIDENIQ